MEQSDVRAALKRLAGEVKQELVTLYCAPKKAKVLCAITHEVEAGHSTITTRVRLSNSTKAIETRVSGQMLSLFSPHIRDFLLKNIVKSLVRAVLRPSWEKMLR